jgi:hypothetical protein
MAEKERTWMYDGITFRKCPKCDKGIPKGWDEHKKCGWKENPTPDVTEAKEAINEMKQEGLNTEQIMDLAHNYVDTKFVAYTPEAKARLVNMFVMDYRKEQWIKNKGKEK